MLQATRHEARIGLHRPDLDLAAGVGQAGGGGFAAVFMDDQLGDHRVVELADLAALHHAGVDADVIGHDEVLQTPDRRQEAVGRVFGVEAGLHGPALHRDVGLRQRDRLTCRDAQLPFDQIDAGDGFRHRVFDLQPGVHLHEPDAVGLQPVGGVGDELDGACALIVHGLGGAHSGGGDGVARGLIHPGRRRLFDHLLVAALQRAVAFMQVDDVALAVAEDLHLDMTRTGDVALDQHARIAEGRLPLALGRGQIFSEVLGPVDLAHPLAAAAGDRLDQHREADAVRLGAQGLQRLVLALIAGGDGHARLDHQLFRCVFQTHGADRRRLGADPDDASRRHRLGEVGVFGQEAIAGVDGLRPRRLGRRQHLGRVQIGLARRRRADQHRLVRLAHMQGVGVGLGIDGDGAQAHATGGAEDAAGDLAAIGDQDGFEHQAFRSGE